MDINLLRLSIHYHEEDLLKMNGIWPDEPKAKPTLKQIRNALKG